MNKINNDLKFAYILTLAFFILTLFNILHHEMWRDELEAWMISRDAVSLRGLVENVSYTGHPMLWYLILYPVTKITRNPMAMQMVHLCISTISAFLFLKFAPFSKFLKGLFIFGYFPFFEYAAVSRDYCTGILFLFIFCTYFGKDLKNRNHMLLSIILFFMCQCNALSTVLAIALAVTLFLEPLFTKDFTVYKSGRFYISILIFTVGLILSIVQMIPPTDSIFYNPVIVVPNVMERVADQISTIWNAFVPVPRFQISFWNTNFISYLPVQKDIRYAVRFILSVGLLLFSFFILFRKKTPAFYYALSVVGVSAFGYIFFEGYMRQRGHYYYAFISALWISSYYPAVTASYNPFLNFFEKNKNRFLAVIFSFGLIGALTANTIDYIYPFSESKNAADYIKQNGWQNMKIAGSWDVVVSGVSAYLDRPIYYPMPDKIGTFIVWKSRKDVNKDALFASEKYKNAVKEDVLVVFNDPVKDYKILQYRLIPLKQFTQSVVRNENLYLYMMKYENHDK